jgi:ATP-binding cassette subfamily F protein 3
MLDVNALTYRIGGRVLFEDASLHVSAGQRVGLVGRNGAGKSTLFKLILGELQPDSGSVEIGSRVRVGCVAQESPDSPLSLVDWVLAQDRECAELTVLSETATDPQVLADAHERLAAIAAHAAPARAAAILAGLGFAPETQARPVAELSGGWRMRVALAGTLFARPDLLLLDEPTNHLDLEATIWLQGYLESFPGTLIIISHDREILNAVPERIVHIDQGRLVMYGGNYDRFEQVRREKQDLLAKAAAKQADQRARLQAFVDRFRAKATKAAQAQSRLKMIERLGPPIAVVEEQSVSFDFPDPEELPPPLLQIEQGEVGYEPGKPVLRGLDLRLDMDDRIALLGANGNGKSTLAKVFAGRLALTRGSIFRAGKLRVGYFAQHQTEELDPARTPFDHMQDLMPKAAEPVVRAQLGRFAFSQERADVPVASLSGGEKARLLFALMSRDAPHLMILDEPTNHLDIDAREALVAALNAYAGAVILVSHDPHLISLTVDRLWLVAKGRVQSFDGDLDAYRKLLLEQSGAARRAAREASGASGTRKDERRSAAEQRARLAPLRKRAQDAEKRIEDLTRRKAALETKLADPALYAGPAAEITGVQRDMAALVQAIGDSESDWLVACVTLER